MLDDGSGAVEDAGEATRYSNEAKIASRLGVPTQFDQTMSKRGKETELSSPLVTVSDVKEYKAAVDDAWVEYFESESMEELEETLLRLASPFQRFEVIKRGVIMSMGRKERERALVSLALSEMYARVLSADMVAEGFRRLLRSVDDICLDNPGGDAVLANFLGRAVSDEVLAPAFLSGVIAELGEDASDLACSTVATAKGMLSTRHAGTRMAHVWHTGAVIPVEELKQRVRDAVEEFYSSEDLGEVGRCVRELEQPHYHHEVVKRAVVVAIDRGEREADLASAFLAYAVFQGIISREQVAQGLLRVRRDLPDMALDNPGAAAVFAGVWDRAVADGCLPDAPADDGSA
jgi:programmed cell death protein 4